MQILQRLRGLGFGRALSLSQLPASLLGIGTATLPETALSSTSESPAALRQPEITRRQLNNSIIPGRYRTRVPVRTTAQVQSDLEETQSQLTSLESEYSSKKSQLFAIERETELLLTQQFQPQISRLQTKIKELKTELADHSVNAQYQLVDIAFLQLVKDQNGTKLPRFVLFDTVSDRFALRIDCWKHHDSPYLARSVPKLAGDLFDTTGLHTFGLEFMEREQEKENEAAKKRDADRDRLWNSGPGRVRQTHVTIECQFGGQLPAPIRRTIAKNADCFDRVRLRV